MVDFKAAWVNLQVTVSAWWKETAQTHIRSFSFLVAESPWTSIKQSQTLTSHNPSLHCRACFYVHFRGTTFVETAVCRENKRRSGMLLFANYPRFSRSIGYPPEVCPRFSRLWIWREMESAPKIDTNVKAFQLLKPGFHMSGKSHTIRNFTFFRPSQILPIYRICARGLFQISPIMNFFFW